MVSRYTLRRFPIAPVADRPMVLAEDSAAVRFGRTRYPAMVRDVGRDAVLKSGKHNRKIGAVVRKGRWKDMPIYTLTLEERATCPRSCGHWLDCYGNAMHWSTRWRKGADLEEALEEELAALQEKHPAGFVVRLHVLGDFYSYEYVVQWHLFLMLFPALRVYGYTAHSPDTEIGNLLDQMSQVMWDRFAMRFSLSGMAERATGADGIVCPAQTGATDCCATCGLCWQTKRNIHFLDH